jgi:hypothetical protein
MFKKKNNHLLLVPIVVLMIIGIAILPDTGLMRSSAVIPETHSPTSRQNTVFIQENSSLQETLQDLYAEKRDILEALTIKRGLLHAVKLQGDTRGPEDISPVFLSNTLEAEIHQLSAALEETEIDIHDVYQKIAKTGE